MATKNQRVVIYMADAVKDFYSQLAEEMGISISAAMVVGLKAYMDAQKGLQMSTDLKEMLSQLQIMQKQQADTGNK